MKTICGLTWEQIQKAQQKEEFREYAPTEILKPQATKADITLLEEKGIDFLKEKEFYGIIDRLKNSGLIN